MATAAAIAPWMAACAQWLSCQWLNNAVAATTMSVQGIDAASNAIDCAGHTAQEPADTGAEGEEIGAGGQSGKRKAQGEIVATDPPLPIEKLAM